MRRKEDAGLDEVQTQIALYGNGARSGHVRLTPLFPDEFGRIAGLTDDWIEWDRISWKDPREMVTVYSLTGALSGVSLVSVKV